MTASDIIAMFSTGGGPAHEAGRAELAKALGAPLSTVSSWGRFNYIPEWRQPPILALASSRGIALSTADFPTKAEKSPRAAA
jgi:hypothetical protein